MSKALHMGEVSDAFIDALDAARGQISRASFCQELVAKAIGYAGPRRQSDKANLLATENAALRKKLAELGGEL